MDGKLSVLWDSLYLVQSAKLAEANCGSLSSKKFERGEHLGFDLTPFLPSFFSLSNYWDKIAVQYVFYNALMF